MLDVTSHLLPDNSNNYGRQPMFTPPPSYSQSSYQPEPAYKQPSYKQQPKESTYTSYQSYTLGRVKPMWPAPEPAAATPRHPMEAETPEETSKAPQGAYQPQEPKAAAPEPPKEPEPAKEPEIKIYYKEMTTQAPAATEAPKVYYKEVATTAAPEPSTTEAPKVYYKTVESTAAPASEVPTYQEASEAPEPPPSAQPTSYDTIYYKNDAPAETREAPVETKEAETPAKEQKEYDPKEESEDEVVPKSVDEAEKPEVEERSDRHPRIFYKYYV